MSHNRDALLSPFLRENQDKIKKMRMRLPLLFGTLNILNVIDKVVTWMALKNPLASELNPMARYTIDRLGIMTAMMVYTIIGFVIFYIVYKIVTKKRSLLEKHNMPPEKFFLMLNIAFCLVVINNIFWLLYNKLNI